MEIKTITHYFNNTEVVLWSFSVTIDNGIIIDADNKPNGRPHWIVGKTIDEVNQYYSHNTKIN